MSKLVIYEKCTYTIDLGKLSIDPDKFQTAEQLYEYLDENDLIDRDAVTVTDRTVVYENTKPKPKTKPEANRFRNHYMCLDCPNLWSDDWSCQPDDECPNCNKPYSPYFSQDIDEDGNVTDGTDEPIHPL